ncbi:hypothetical protein [Candidatus Nanohalovita haloferacivicina]|uniref:hypothetical protein n=1 Tax=Candidatus Nanohalovita haloferacivicina TaxID=2978046 RepID=UPI00325FD312|nr:hypothetical protein HBNXNv_0855 [Candidatus Nanohalobia archaeon BNXNv]
MHPAVKILIGALMVVVGVYSTATQLDKLLYLVKGSIGPLLVLIGAFIIWLESDEWKMMRDSSRGDSVQQQFQPANQGSVQEEVKEQVEKTEEEVEEEKHACPECGKEFDTERGMKIHYSQKHE